MNDLIMEDIWKFWDNGLLQPWRASSAAGEFQRTAAFCAQTGATHVVELRWTAAGQTVSCPFPAKVLPDLSGVVMLDEWHFQGQPRHGLPPWQKHLRVLNADGSLRLRLFAPVLDGLSKPDESWIEEPRDFSEHGFPFGVPASDGYRDLVVEYDWHAGNVLRWINAAPWLNR